MEQYFDFKVTRSGALVLETGIGALPVLRYASLHQTYQVYRPENWAVYLTDRTPTVQITDPGSYRVVTSNGTGVAVAYYEDTELAVQRRIIRAVSPFTATADPEVSDECCTGIRAIAPRPLP